MSESEPASVYREQGGHLQQRVATGKYDGRPDNNRDKKTERSRGSQWFSDTNEEGSADAAPYGKELDMSATEATVCVSQASDFMITHR